VNDSSKSKVISRSAARISWWLDAPWWIPELLLRNVYWRWARLRRWGQRRNRRQRPAIQECAREDLRTHLRTIGVTSGALVLMHTRVTGVHIHSGGSPGKANSWETAGNLLSDLLELLGPAGTLVMATNAKYQEDTLEESGSACDIITYDPSRTSCGVGLTNELFWRKNGVKRSLFPYNMLAACGPLTDELLWNNLNEQRPSPHGADSGYYRICQRNGLVVSIGVPLRECITIAHVVEEVRPGWPIKDFFTERRFRVARDGVAKEWTVRLPRDEYGKFCWCHKKMGRDLVAEGVIHEGSVGTVRVDWAKAGEVYEFFWHKTAKRPYPYFALWLGRKR
jgi:aminoglycoside N3'-acetyltransferase